MTKERRHKINGAAFRALRHKECISVTAIAEILGVSQSTVEIAEKGHAVMSVFFGLCDIFEVNPVDYLVARGWI